MKSYIFTLRTAPHSGNGVQEILDMILTTAAFEQQVAVLLLDDGVFALKNQQQPEKQQLKDTLAIFKALEIYDIEDIYVENESLQERGLTVTDLALPVKIVQRQEVNGLLQQHAIAFSG